MQPLLWDFVRDALDVLDAPGPVWEFGALQVEADQDGDLRPLFAGREFVGTDFRAGPGVDRVEDLRDLSLPDDAVGTALCLETLEHCEDPLAAGRELARVVAPGGICLVSTPFLLGIHGYPDDFFRFTPSALRSLLGAFDAVWTTGVGDADSPLWCLAVAANGPLPVSSLADLPRLAAAQERWDRAAGRVRIGPLQLAPGEAVRTVGRELWRLGRERVRR